MDFERIFGSLKVKNRRINFIRFGIWRAPFRQKQYTIALYSCASEKVTLSAVLLSLLPPKGFGGSILVGYLLQSLPGVLAWLCAHFKPEAIPKSHRLF
jgi:hypothetical protein